MKKLLENTVVTWIWLCTAAILLLTVLLLIGFAVTMLGDNSAGSLNGLDFSAVLPVVMRQLAFSVGTAVCGVAAAVPLALALAILSTYLLPGRIGFWLGRAGFCYSAVPAVVLGYMALRYIVPRMPGIWSGLSISLALMAVPRLCSDFYTVFRNDRALRLASACLGGRTYQTVLYFSFPAHRQELLYFSLGALARAICEGVAVLMVLLHYEKDYNTLVTGTMRSLGVMSAGSSIGLAIIQSVVLLLPLSVLYITIYVLREQ